jgi:anti-anti-sigma factor
LELLRIGGSAPQTNEVMPSIYRCRPTPSLVKLRRLKQPGPVVPFGELTRGGAMGASLCFHVDQDWDGPVVRLHGEIDLATVGPLHDHLLHERDDAVLTIDFSGVTFMDSSGVNLLTQLQHRVREQNGKLMLYGMGPNQMRILKALGLVDYFDSIVPD